MKGRILFLVILSLFILVPVVKGDTAILWCNEFTNTVGDWDTHSGASPYLGDNDDYIRERSGDAIEDSYYRYTNFTANPSAVITEVNLYIEARSTDGDDGAFVITYVNHTASVCGYNKTIWGTVYDWYVLPIGQYQYSGKVDTIYELNRTWTKFFSEQVGGGDDVYVRRAYLNVTYTTNVPPVNYAWSISDMDLTDNINAERKYYTASLSASDEDGYANFDQVQLNFRSGGIIGLLRFTESTNTHSVGAPNLEINSSLCSYSKSGNWLNVTWRFFNAWDFGTYSDLDLEAYSLDDAGESDSDTTSNYVDSIQNLVTNWIECSDPDDRVHINVNTDIDFSTRYEDDPNSGIPSSFYPPDSEFTSISVYNSTNGVKGTDSTIVSGNGSITFTNTQTKNETYNLFINLDDNDYTDKELTDVTELIEWYSDIVIGVIDRLFGSGFNGTPPYVMLYWNYNGTPIGNYEIERSTDGIIYSFLAYTANPYYNDSGLINGSYYWYRVRGTYFNASWFNSSYSDPNLERVFFALGGGGGPVVVASSLALSIILFVIGLLTGKGIPID